MGNTWTVGRRCQKSFGRPRVAGRAGARQRLDVRSAGRSPHYAPLACATACATRIRVPCRLPADGTVDSATPIAHGSHRPRQAPHPAGHAKRRPHRWRFGRIRGSSAREREGPRPSDAGTGLCGFARSFDGRTDVRSSPLLGPSLSVGAIGCWGMPAQWARRGYGITALSVGDLFHHRRHVEEQTVAFILDVYARVSGAHCRNKLVAARWVPSGHLPGFQSRPVH